MKKATALVLLFIFTTIVNAQRFDMLSGKLENLKEIYPEISSDDIRFCALLKLNFSTKDIAEYTFVTVRSVQTRKSRLRKKFNITSDEDIYLWMNELG